MFFVKCVHEIKKIQVSEDLQNCTCNVEFVLSDFRKLPEFKKQLTKFSNEIEGQSTLE